MIDRPIRILNTSLATQIAMVHILLPYMILPIANALRQIDPSLARAASESGITVGRSHHVYVHVTDSATSPATMQIGSPPSGGSSHADPRRMTWTPAPPAAWNRRPHGGVSSARAALGSPLRIALIASPTRSIVSTIP